MPEKAHLKSQDLKWFMERKLLTDVKSRYSQVKDLFYRFREAFFKLIHWSLIDRYKICSNWQYSKWLIINDLNRISFENFRLKRDLFCDIIAHFQFTNLQICREWFEKYSSLSIKTPRSLNVSTKMILWSRIWRSMLEDITEEVNLLKTIAF